MNLKGFFIIISAIFLITGCNKKNDVTSTTNLTIVFINDQHGQIDNFSKLKHLVDQEKKTSEVIVACSGDMFSGNPIVDIYEEKGYPMIDLMNKVGFSISVIGNHEFDYGQDILARRMEQSDFDWVCANVDMADSGIPQPFEYRTINIGTLKVTFLGLVETNGKPDLNIPSTHPSKVEEIIFQRPEDVVAKFDSLKFKEDADLYIALSHLGHNNTKGHLGDFQLARQFPYFDLIIGGHTNPLLDTVINNIPVFQAGKYLEHAGVIKIEIKDKEIENIDYEIVDLNAYPDFDEEVQAAIDEYNQSMAPVLAETIGHSEIDHERYQLGCFYTDALKGRLGVEVSLQNYGGIRSGLNEGPVSIREIYEIDPFNNGTMIYTMSVLEMKELLKGMQSTVFYSGIQIEQIGVEVRLSDEEGTEYNDEEMITLGINDYIPAVYDSYFPDNGEKQDFTTAEAIIYYLKNMNDLIDYPECGRFFKYQ